MGTVGQFLSELTRTYTIIEELIIATAVLLIGTLQSYQPRKIKFNTDISSSHLEGDFQRLRYEVKP